MISSQQAEDQSGMKLLVNVVLAIWFGLVFLLGANGVFVSSPEVPPLPIFLGVAVPVLVFVAAYWGSGLFRALILAADLPLLRRSRHGGQAASVFWPYTRTASCPACLRGLRGWATSPSGPPRRGRRSPLSVGPTSRPAAYS